MELLHCVRNIEVSCLLTKKKKKKKLPVFKIDYFSVVFWWSWLVSQSGLQNDTMPWIFSAELKDALKLLTAFHFAVAKQMVFIHVVHAQWLLTGYSVLDILLHFDDVIGLTVFEACMHWRHIISHTLNTLRIDGNPLFLQKWDRTL